MAYIFVFGNQPNVLLSLYAKRVHGIPYPGIVFSISKHAQFIIKECWCVSITNKKPNELVMLGFNKILHLRKKLGTGVLALGSKDFLLLVHGILVGACNFTRKNVDAPAKK